MRTLYIVRHAKASPALPGMDDFDRPLNEQGMHDAALMAARFAARKEPVDLLVASTAKRTLATARQFSSALGNAAVQGEPRIYMASLPGLLAILNAFPQEAGRAMLVGHNPGVTELVAELSGGGPGHLAPGTAVRIDLHVDHWQEVAAGTGTLAWWDSPARG